MVKNTKRFIWPDLIQTLVSGCHNCPMCLWHFKCSVPLALLKVKCPWHLKCSVPLALSPFFTAQFTASCWVGTGITSLSRFLAHLGDDLGTSCLVVGFLLVFSFPLGMEWIATQAVSIILDWAESSCPPMLCDGIADCPMLACWPLCKCHTFTAVLFWREVNFHMNSHVCCWLANRC